MKSITSIPANNEKIHTISIIIVTYNSKKYIDACIKSIIQQTYPENYCIEIIIIDNYSTDGTCDFIKEKFPHLKIIENYENNGYGKANNLVSKYADGKYLFILNPDTIVEKNWLEKLINPLTKNEKLITTPKILVYDGSKINGCGLIVHFTGLGFTRGFRSVKNEFSKMEYVNGIFGCCFAIKKDDFIKLGGFDENIFMYEEDVDLSFRAHIKNFRILYIPSSVIKHDYSLKVPAEKIYHLEKGRYIILKKYMTFIDLLILSPSFLMAEALVFGYSIKFGFNGLKFKFKAMRDGFSIKVMKMNNENNDFKKSLDIKIPLDQLTANQVEKTIKIIFNKIFELNYVLFRILKS
jgi:GT2 family glycosyltransferase